MTVCVGCGLTDNGSDPVFVAVSGTWGGAGLGFGADDQLGAPIYCDDAGELRTVPEHTSSTFTDSASTSPGAGFSSSAVFGVTRNLVLANPSSVRQCSFLLVFRVKFGITVVAAGFAYAIITATDGGGDVTHEAALWGVEPSAGSYNIDLFIPDHIAGALAAGDTTSIDIKPKIDATGGGSGTLGTQSIRSEAILVTV